MSLSCQERKSIRDCIQTRHMTFSFWLGPPSPPTPHRWFRDNEKRLRQWLGKSISRQAARTSPNLFSLSFTGSLSSAKHNSMPCACNASIQFGDHIAGGDVYAGDRLRCNDQPAYGCRRCRHGVQDAFLEEFGVGEEQRRIPPKQDQPGDPACIRISRDVVITFDAMGATQYGGVWAPTVPQELGDGDGDCETYSWNHSEHCHADKADDR